MKPPTKNTKKVIIMGAAGRDFHDFLAFFKDNPKYKVVAFTATQIPGIAQRSFPKSMAGKLYNKNIPIFPEDRLEKLIREKKVDEVIFSYSDVSNKYISERRRVVNKAGARFSILKPELTMLKSKKPVIAICAVRTGSGKSPTTRKICRIIREMKLRAVVIRHPMPYGDIEKQAVQRFKTLEDLKKQECTLEEKEEYESNINMGFVVYAGVDYERIMRAAEKEADIIVWDGGNNDLPFFKPDLHIVIADARRPGHELYYYHGAENIKRADIVIINKVKTSTKKAVSKIESNIKKLNNKATVLHANMTKTADKPDLIKGMRVLVIEDGPTLTHGGLSIGAGYLAAKKYLAKEIIDPRPYSVGSIKATLRKFKHLESVLPAMGYEKKQMRELEATIKRTPCDTVIIGTPIDLGKHIKINKPFTKVHYDIHLMGKKNLKDIITDFVKKHGKR